MIRTVNIGTVLDSLADCFSAVVVAEPLVAEQLGLPEDAVDLLRVFTCPERQEVTQCEIR